MQGETIGAVVQPLPTSHLIFRAPTNAAGKCWMDALELALRWVLAAQLLGQTGPQHSFLKGHLDPQVQLPECHLYLQVQLPEGHLYLQVQLPEVRNSFLKVIYSFRYSFLKVI